MKRSVAGWVWVGVAGLALGAAFGSCAERSTQAVAAPAAATTQVVGGLPGFADLAEVVQPAVVNIATTRLIAGRGLVPGFDLDQIPPQFRDFFKFFGPQGGEPAPQRKRQANSLGSGFFIDAGGYVVTNNHVVDGADEIQVITADGKTLAVEVVGTDPGTDIALLRVKEASKVPYLRFGDSDKLRVGEWVLAVGNPFGLSHTVTAGIVSAKGRSIGSDLPYQDFIQTDASINPGNSGGPLINLAGEVVGVNSAIFSRTGQSAGIGFAVPSNLAAFVVGQLRKDKKVVRGYIGVHIQGIDDAIAESMGLSDKGGAIVTEVFPDTPGAKAGLKVGDVIVGFNGQPIKHFQELPLKVSTTAPGTKVELDIVRDGKSRKVTLTLGELPTGSDRAAPNQTLPQGQPEEPRTVLQMGVRAVDPADRKRLGLAPDQVGLIVESVAPDSPAADAGIREGEVLLRAGSIELARPQDLEDAVSKAKAEGKTAILLLVSRDGQNRFVGVDLR